MATYWISPTGNNTTGSGTQSSPWATLQKAHTAASSGDTISMRGGFYPLAMNGWNWETTGITVSAYGSEVPILSNGQLLAWTWNPSTYGGCWSATASHTAGYDYVIPLGSRPCTTCNTIGDFTNPQTSATVSDADQPGLAHLADSNGYMIYNLVWYSGGVVYFKSANPGGVIQVTDPDHQLFYTNSQFSFNNSSGCTFSGLTFVYANYMHQQGGGLHVGATFKNCIIKYMEMGFGSYDIYSCTYSGNWIDKTGETVVWNSGYSQYMYNSLSWGFYVDGSGCSFTSNLVARSSGGFQLYPNGVTGAYLGGNVVYHCQHADAIMSSSLTQGINVLSENNIYINAYGTGAYIQGIGFTFRHNYSEGYQPISLQASGSTSYFYNFSITDNICNYSNKFYANGSRLYITGLIDPAGTYGSNQLGWAGAASLIDRNVYLGDATPYAYYLTIASQAGVGSAHTFSTFAAYKSYLQGLQWPITSPPSGTTTAQTASWEANSSESSLATQFDFSAGDALLDSNPTLRELQSHFGDYVSGIQEVLGTSSGPGGPPAPTVITLTNGAFTGTVITLTQGNVQCGGIGLLQSFANRWLNDPTATAMVPFDRFVTSRIPNVEEYPFPYMSLLIPGGSRNGRSDRSEWVSRTAAIHLWVDMAKLEEGEAICEKIRQIYCNQSWRYDYGDVIDVLDHGPPNIIEINEAAFSYKELTKTMTLRIQQKRVDTCVNICQPCGSSSSAPLSSSSG